MSGTGSPRMKLLAPVFVLLLTASLYLPALSYGFVCDDSQQIVQSQPRFTWSALPSYFTSDVWSYLVVIKSNYYRPIFLVWLLLNSKLFGLSTILWHAAAIALHLAATYLFYLLALELAGEVPIAAAAALLFGVHPAHVEAVAWVSGVTEPLFAVAAFAALLLHLRRKRALSLAMLGVALITKETAVILPVLLALSDWMFLAPAEAGRRQRFKWMLERLIMPIGLLVAYLGVRAAALGQFAPLLHSWTLHMVLKTIPSVLVFYLRQLLWPVEYSLFYPIRPIVSVNWHTFGEPLLIVAVAAALLFWIARQSKALAFSVALLILPILPVLNLQAFALDDFQHDRYVYVPSAGLCLIAAILGARWIRPRVAQAVALAAVVGVFAYVSVQISGNWSDNTTLYSHAVAVAPDSDIAAEYLGGEFLAQGRYADALPLLKRAFLRDDGASVYEQIAECYIGLMDYDTASNYLRDEISLYEAKLHHVLWGARSDLAQIDLKRGDLADAEAQTRRALEAEETPSPSFAPVHGLLAKALAGQGKTKEALAEYQRQASDDPDSIPAQDELRDFLNRSSVK